MKKEKQFMVTTGTADTRVHTQYCTHIYNESTLLNSDYKNFLPKKLHATTTHITEVIGIDSTPLASPNETITWVTTITRIK